MSKPAKKKTTKRAAPKKKASKKSAPTRRRNNPTPIVLVNPSPSGGRTVAKKKAKKRAPAKRKTPAKKAPAKRKRNPSSPPAKKAPRRRRRRNPSTSFGQAMMGTGAGALGGLAAFGANMGIQMIPVAEWGKVAITAGLGLGAGTLASKLGAPNLGAGYAGAAAASTVGRIQIAYALREAAKETAAAPPQITPAADAGRVFTESGRVFQEAGRVYDESGRLVPQRGAKTLPAKQLEVRSLKEAGRMVNVAGGPMRLTGPHSWATKQYVSAHNR